MTAVHGKVGTVAGMESDGESDLDRMRELHDTAERGIAEALSAVVAAQVLIADSKRELDASFEYGQAVRDLRAALTAIRSARLDWAHDEARRNDSH